MLQVISTYIVSAYKHWSLHVPLDSCMISLNTAEGKQYEEHHEDEGIAHRLGRAFWPSIVDVLRVRRLHAVTALTLVPLVTVAVEPFGQLLEFMLRVPASDGECAIAVGVDAVAGAAQVQEM